MTILMIQAGNLVERSQIDDVCNGALYGDNCTLRNKTIGSCQKQREGSSDQTIFNSDSERAVTQCYVSITGDQVPPEPPLMSGYNDETKLL